jgi:hypothetical protein
VTVPDEVVELVRKVAADASEDEVAAILAAYPALRQAAHRLYELPLEPGTNAS